MLNCNLLKFNINIQLSRIAFNGKTILNQSLVKSHALKNPQQITNGFT